MRIIPFPGGGHASPDEGWHAELEAALNGEREGTAADSWRELCEDVRALAPPMSPEFARQLRARIAERDADRRPREPSPSDTPGPRSAADPHRRPRWIRRHGRLSGVAGAVAIAGTVAAALLVTGPPQAGVVAKAPPAVTQRGPALEGAGAAVRKASSSAASPSGATNAPAAEAPVAPAPSGAASAPGREQQLAATITLATSAVDVQATSDRVARLAVGEQGFVQNSHVQVQQGGASEANLALRLPSAKLSAALGALAQLAPVRAESQSLQDITDAYDAAGRRLADATAERQALLRALSAATTQGQIESLRAQLSQARSAIAQARSGLQAISQRASTAEVEVTVSGDGHGASEGLTLHGGLHAAGRVLIVTLVVVLVAAAILVPLALLLVLLAGGRSAWRRYQRERALDAS